jgi:ABC-2 type transport system ATP-binding protein
MKLWLKSKKQTVALGSSDKNIAVIANGLTKKFGKFIAVNNISFKVKRGEIFGFLGPNGAGKSLYEDLTVEQNINFYGGVYALEGARFEERKRWAIEMAGLKGKENILTHALSGGWRQRLALGCSVLHEPPILFLDEPTGGVDPVSRRNFWNLIYDLSNRGVTVFVTTHYMDEAEHCNTIGLIYNGKLIAIGSPTELKHNLDRYSVFEVLCDKPVEAMELLRRQEWTAETSIFGSVFHVSMINEQNAQKKIRGLLTGEKITTERVEQIVPSLEDVFIHMIADEDERNK